MTAEEFCNLKKLLKKLNTKDLITMVTEDLAKIKQILTIINMIVIELQVRKLDL